MDIDKIRDEMAKLPSGSPVNYVGEYATLRCTQDGLTVAAGKTLAGAFKAIEDYARKHKSGSSAVVPDTVAWELVDDYYGWPHKLAGAEQVQAPAEIVPVPVEDKQPEPAPVKPSADPFALPDLGDLW